MYIWILLATIMVALSFLNTSPREDKADVFREVRAASFVNRFRVEHIAFMQTIECPFIYNIHDYTNGQVFGETDKTNGYTSYDENLPVGYNEGDSDISIHHYVYCFKKDETMAKSTEKDRPTVGEGARCTTSSEYRYAISFAQIPEKWLNKAKEKFTGAPADGAITPQASFINYLAGETSGMKNIGWVWCADGPEGRECHLVGRTAAHSWYDKSVANANNVSKLKYMQFLFPSSLMTNSEFKSECVDSGVPCLFSYGRLRTDDANQHCYALCKSKGNC